MGIVVPMITLTTTLSVASVLLIIVGMLAGLFVVPMNALLQHRGYVTLTAGQSIAVQNFNENLNVLLMLGIYATLLYLDISINVIISLFGVFVAVTMSAVTIKCIQNKKKVNFGTLIGDKRQAIRQK